MKILVTGGAGFIGSHLCEVLLRKRHRVTIVDNLSLGTERNIARLSLVPGFKFYKDDVLDKPRLESIFRRGGFDMVYHLAANSDIARSHKDPGVDLDNTFLTTYSVADCMRKFGVRKIFFASSSAIYGPAEGRIGENYGPLQPVSHYGAAKLASEAFLTSFSENYGFSVWIARFPNVVGERATHGVIYDFIRKLKNDPRELEILGDGRQTKPYLYVRDLVSAIGFMCANSSKKLNIYNIGVDSSTNVRTIARYVAKEMGLSPRFRFTGGKGGWVGDVPNFKYDNSRLKKLGWSASASSDEAVRLAARMILREGI